ncbi:tail adaptor [Caudoviricetes sp.]|nr:tail adaptor [Caudoviricetes sp.]
MATGQTLVNRALRLLGVISSGETPTSDESNDTLTAINAMLDSWRNDRLMCYALQDETLTLVASDSSYTIGTGGQLNTTRPVSIESCYCRASSIDYPVKIISFEDWNSIVDKTASSDIPECVYYEPTMATGTLRVWPVPNTANVLHLTTRVPLTALTLAGTVSLPPGWEDSIASNGAIAIAPEFQVEPSSAVVKMANDSLKGIKRINSRPIMANTEMALMFGIQRSNIITDTP